MQIGKIKALATELLNRPPTADNIFPLRKIVQKCRSLEEEILEWGKNLPESYSWKTVAWEYRVPRGDYSTAEVYPGRIDLYRNIWAASLLNFARTGRIVVTSVMMRCVAFLTWPNDYRTTIEYAAVTKAWSEEMSSIVASVPYLLGWFAKHRELRKDLNLSAYGCGEDDATKALPGFLLIWPLATLEAHDYTTDAQRAWIRGRLAYIGQHLGVRSATKRIQVRPCPSFSGVAVVAPPLPLCLASITYFSLGIVLIFPASSSLITELGPYPQCVRCPLLNGLSKLKMMPKLHLHEVVHQSVLRSMMLANRTRSRDHD